MPWQKQVCEVATEYDPVTGLPYYREVFVTTPRQSGKTTLILVLLILNCWVRDNQACVWTGQDGASIRRKWLNEILPLLRVRDEFNSPAEEKRLIRRIRLAAGGEAVHWSTGSRIELLPTSKGAGHGMVIDFAVLDEIFDDHDNRRVQALEPATATREHAQLFFCSTAGDAASVLYNDMVRRGRQAVTDGLNDEFAYFEWSAPEDWDPEDDDSFFGFHPALGHTISLRVLRQARSSHESNPQEFARAYGNRPSLDGAQVIPDVAWARVVDRSAEPDVTGGLVIALDVSAEQDSAAIAVADAQGVCELIEYRAGVNWLLERAAELADTYRAPVVFDKGGPARMIEGLASLDAAQPMTSTDVIDACGWFFNAVADMKVTVRQDDAVDRAVRGLEKKTVGDAYVWSRRASSKDVTPLYAITLAYAAAKNPTSVYAGPLVAAR